MAAALAVAAALVFSGRAAAEDVPFSPRKDAEQPRPKRQEEKPAKEVYSFARYEGLFRPLCRAIQPDGHVDRLLEAAEAILREDSECQSCRAFARAVDVACREFGSQAETQKSKSAQAAKRKRTTPTPTPTPPEEEGEEGQEGEQGEEAGDEDGDSPSDRPGSAEAKAAPPAIVRQRLPSAQVVELASMVSTRMHSDEPGPEPTLRALEALLQRVLSSPGLSRGERGYFDALRDYLTAAWQGQPAAGAAVGHTHGGGAH